MPHAPLRFVPFLRPMVWGGRRLREVLGQPVTSDEAHGESWVVSDHAMHHSEIASGPWAGRTLRSLMETEASFLLGQRNAPVFPWLVKFLDAHDWLSVQVHPDDESVERLLPGEGGKTEAWFVLDAAPGSRIYAGLLPGVDEQRLRSALASGTVAECLHSFEPRAGDCVFLPAGTVHAVGGGVLMAEVQQTSDATFRLFDWNRRDAQGKLRPLHIEQAMACIDWKRGPVTPIRVEAFTSESRGLGIHRQPLVRCPHFELDFMQAGEPFDWGGEGRLQVVLVLQGSGRVETTWGEENLKAGQAWLLPAGMGKVRCVPEVGLALLVCALP